MIDQCGVCAAHTESADGHCLAWQSDLWVLRHHPLPAPLVGWFLLDARRHVASAADLNASEEKQFAQVLGASMRAIRTAMGVPRVYVVMFGEGAHHLHAHLIARDPSNTATKSWSVADLYRLVESGKRPPADGREIATVVARLREFMRTTTLR